MDGFSQFGAVALVLALLVGVLWCLRRRGLVISRAGSRGTHMEHMERLPLGPQHALHLVRVGGAALLVAASPAGCSLILNLGVTAPDKELSR